VAEQANALRVRRIRWLAGSVTQQSDAAVLRVVEEHIGAAVEIASGKVRGLALEQQITVVRREESTARTSGPIRRGRRRGWDMAYQIDAEIQAVVKEQIAAAVAVAPGKIRGKTLEQHITAIR
jgi:hypothetical protein